MYIVYFSVPASDGPHVFHTRYSGDVLPDFELYNNESVWLVPGTLDD